MIRISEIYDPAKVEWRRVTDVGSPDCPVDFEYSLLGYDLAAGRLDMLLRWPGQSYCRRHRHVAATMTLVLEGEQHLLEHLPDGSKQHIIRRKGDYALAPADALPHDEHGGPEGGTVLLSMQAKDGVLFEYFDETMQNGWTLTVADYVEAWEKGEIYGRVAAEASAG